VPGGAIAIWHGAVRRRRRRRRRRSLNPNVFNLHVHNDVHNSVRCSDIRKSLRLPTETKNTSFPTIWIKTD